MMPGAMPIRGPPGQGPRTGTTIRGPMGRGDYGKYDTTMKLCQITPCYLIATWFLVCLLVK